MRLLPRSRVCTYSKINNVITFMPVTTEWLSTCATSLTRSGLESGGSK